MSNLPKFVTKAIAAHDFNGYAFCRINRFGQNVKPRSFTAYPTEIYMNGADRFGERYLIVEEQDLMSGDIIGKWNAIVSKSGCHQI